jgi:SAM-dependent methyltransferase
MMQTIYSQRYVSPSPAGTGRVNTTIRESFHLEKGSRHGEKQAEELEFWAAEVERYVAWYSGELPRLYNTPSPEPAERVRAPNIRHASILTWHRLHQEPKYLSNLDLAPDAFRGMRLLDVGAGPLPSATCFEGAHLYCLEPLIPDYLQLGFPLHYYGDVRFVHGEAEMMPFEDNFFDAVIAVNAIDHVDDIDNSANEIRRVLRPGGRFRMHVHYHPAQASEPIELDDERFMDLFGWCVGLRKLSHSTESFSWKLRESEAFVLWSNF